MIFFLISFVTLVTIILVSLKRCNDPAKDTNHGLFCYCEICDVYREPK